MEDAYVKPKTISIVIPSCLFRLVCFAAYNFAYILYMLSYISQNIYLFLLFVFCCLNATIYFLSYLNQIGKTLGKRTLKLSLSYVVTFLVISLGMQIFNGDFSSYLWVGLFRITLPIVSAFFWINTVKESEQKYFFDLLLLRFILHFLWSNLEHMNWQTLLSMSWSNSYSDFESSLAHDFFILECYFLWKKERKRSFISMIFCMLSMKRLSFVLAPLLFVFDLLPVYFPRFCKRIKFFQQESKKRKVSSLWANLLKIVVIVSPLFMVALYSPAGQDLFYSLFKKDLNVFMSGRVSIYYTLVEAIPYYNGYGSVNHFLSSYVASVFGTYWNAVLHNDYIRIYLETGILGVIAITHSLVELSRKEYWIFVMMVYLMVVAITSHIFNYFSVWVTFYMIVFQLNTEREKVFA
ncbi:hypothetical protein FACS189418_0810 [Clostridia bacterium]|nr:hypothetical protein FACS189418_0810 [Clostridia bacterium]